MAGMGEREREEKGKAGREEERVMRRL